MSGLLSAKGVLSCKPLAPILQVGVELQDTQGKSCGSWALDPPAYP